MHFVVAKVIVVQSSSRMLFALVVVVNDSLQTIITKKPKVMEHKRGKKREKEGKCVFVCASLFLLFLRVLCLHSSDFQSILAVVIYLPTPPNGGDGSGGDFRSLGVEAAAVQLQLPPLYSTQWKGNGEEI